MNNTDFDALMAGLKKHLETEKVFIKNPERFAEVEHATEIANQLFADMEIYFKDDPLQMGALVLCIKGFDLVVRGKREITLFQELISAADNFEIYSNGNENITFSILFNGALIRLQ